MTPSRHLGHDRELCDHSEQGWENKNEKVIGMLFVTKALPANLIGMNYGLMSNTLSMW